MGLYDRDYVRDRPRGFSLGGDRSMVTNIILVNVGIFLLDLVLFDRHLTEYLALHADLFTHPWNFWQLLTCGFAHDAGAPGSPILLGNFAHVGFNMFGLWIFGRDVETIYGRKEFLRIYLSLIVLCGLSWVVIQNVLMLAGRDWNPHNSVIGASGAVMGIMVLYVMHYPRRTFLVWFVLPVPAWAVCIFFFLLPNLLGVSGATQDKHVAYEVHLCGALFAFIYYRTGWNLGRLIPRRWADGWRFLSRSRLKVHQPRVDEEKDTGKKDTGKKDTDKEENLNRRVDEILAKISSSGEASLSREERRILEDASRRYQQRRRP